MALINPPAWLQQGSYPAKTDRQVIESIIPVEGVVTGLAVTQTPTASMSVNISAGKGFVAGTSVALQGMYNVVNDAPSSIALPGSNVTNPRYDLIVITINDADVAGSANSAEFKVISGVPSSSPAVPSIPPSTLVLARIYVGAGVASVTSAVITDVRIKTAAKGGIITVLDAASRLRITAPASGDVLFVNEESTGLTWRLKGTTWTPVTGETYVCTSTTRPTGVPQGFKIWETDTRQERLFSGTEWLWNGGVRPAAMSICTSPPSSMSAASGNPTGILLTNLFAVGGVTSVTANGFRYLKVKEAGYYKITQTARLFFSTGVAIGAGAIVMLTGKYSDTLTYIEPSGGAIGYPTGTVNSLSESVATTVTIPLLAGQAVLPLFYRIGGAVDWTVIEGHFTTISIEYVSPL